ncbi:hypothetical protein C5S42_01340, partial [Candidatus Methanomarinus sp.]
MPISFGNVFRRIDPVSLGLLGKKIKLQFAVKARVDIKGKREGFFDNMEDRPIMENDWCIY